MLLIDTIACMKVGIVGLPNVGKSTVFNSLTRAGAEAHNYPFTTIDPNLGVAVVPDERLDALAEAVGSKKVVPTTVDFVDIAGLVRGANRGEGLGNQFLAHIRECDAIAHVVRCFEDENVAHVHGAVNPAEDVEVVNTELLLADLATVEKRLERAGRAAKSGDPKLKAEVAELPEDEAREYLEMLGVETTGFDEFVRAAYSLLGLITFFTFNEKECRAWTVRKGSTARRVAGRIHTDMERGFIAAEVGSWQDVVAAGSWAKAREEAKVRLEGRDYVVRDGDVVLIRFNV